MTFEDAGGVVALVNASADEDLFLGQFCGGIIVSAGVVATATHCVPDSAESALKVVGGVHDLCDDSEPGRQILAVRKVSVAPETDGMVSLLHLDGALEHQLPPRVIGDAAVEAVGWGRSSIAGVPTCELRTVALKPVPASDCADLSGALAPAAILCTVPAKAINTCDGDSGGPVYVRDERGRVAQIAMTMSGLGCGPRSPGLNVIVDIAKWRTSR